MLLTILCCTSITSLKAAISLEKTYKPEAGASFGYIVAMEQLRDGNIVAVDKKSGNLIQISDEKTDYKSLTESSKIFKSESLGGISLAGEDMLAVTNTGDNRFVIVTIAGELVVRMGQSGSSAGSISDPKGVAYSTNQRIYISDYDNNRISVFGSDGVFITTLGRQGITEEKKLRRPTDVFVDRKERLFVFEDVEDGQLVIFDHDGSLIKRITHKRFTEIFSSEVDFSAMTIDKAGLVYLADSANGRVYQFDWKAEKKLAVFGSKGDERGQFNKISALLVLNDGKVAVADSENNKIEIYAVPEQAGEIEEQIRLPTVTRYLPIKMKCNKAYRLNNGGALCLNHDNNKAGIYSDKSKLITEFSLTDAPRSATISDDKIVILDGSRIKIFDNNGGASFEGKGYGGEGSGVGKLSSPSSVFIRHGKIYVADTGNRRIQIYSDDGIYLDKIDSPIINDERLMSEPVAVVVDAQENIFVADKEKRQLHVFSKERRHLYSLGGEDKKPELFKQIFDIAIDEDNNLYVLCATENNKYTVQVYNGPRKIMSFASRHDTDAGLEDPRNITVAKSKRTLVGVYDEEKEKLLNFSYLQVPAKVGGLQIVGSVKSTKIDWTAAPGSFIKGYNIFAAKVKDGPYDFITQVNENNVIINHNEHTDYVFYKVNAFSGLGSQGKFSRIEEDAFINAYQLFVAKEFVKSVEGFKSILDKNTEQPEALKYIGMGLLELNELDSAVHSFRELSRFPGYEVEGLNLQIKALVAAENYIAAKAVIDKVIEEKTAADETYVYCGELSLKLGDPVGAVSCLDEALIRNKNSIEAHFLMGDAYVKLGIIEKGLAEFDKAAELAPENANVWYRSGLVMLDLKKQDKAIERFNKALAIDNKHRDAQLALAKTLLDKKQFAQVKTIAISLAGQKDTAAEGQFLLGLVALAESKNGEALLSIIKATRLDENHSEAWLALADVYIVMGQTDKLRPTLESAVKADKQSFDAALRLGKFEMQEKQYAAAVVQLNNAVGMRRDDYAVRMLLANASLKSADYNQAYIQAIEAKKLKTDDVDALVLLSTVANKQGKIGKAIEYMKQAMEKKPNSLDLTISLGELYSENNLFDKARQQLEKAILLDASAYQPHVLLGDLFLKRRLFDESISSYDKAVALAPGANNKLLLDQAYAEKKKSLEFKSNAPQIVLKDLSLEQIFSAAYKQYASKPVGKIRIQNKSGTDYGDLKISFSIKGYMDFPTTKNIEKLAANETQEIDLLASFNNRILEIDEDTGVQVEVALNFFRDGREDAIKLTQPITIYGKNAILWSNSNMVGSFVTPKDDTLRDFVRQSINENKPEPGPLSDNIVTAMTLFDVYSAHGIRYVVDPNSPYSKVDNKRVDYVQFSRETLKIKSGDCDDLSVLMSAGLENLGVKTAILDVPGHLLMMFDSGFPVSDKDRISLQDNLMVEHEGNIWIPVEATMIGTSFSEAWTEGARKYFKFKQEKSLKTIILTNAWEEYLPVTLKPASYSIEVPSESRVKLLVNREQSILMQKSLDRLVRPYEIISKMHPENTDSLMQVAIIYAKNGLYSQADKTFDKILKKSPNNSAVHNNRGNIFYSKGEFDRAIETYGYAEQLAANDAGVKVNLAMSYYQLGQLENAREKYEEARIIDKNITQQYAGLDQLLSR
ncbi:MAG: tetratricopeptide repeat protein [Gammaproteobacteria bacterium]|nr:tetratricopeptide repeat protein [Gammaproteobacteria bacterium]